MSNKKIKKETKTNKKKETKKKKKKNKEEERLHKILQYYPCIAWAIY